MTEKISAWHIAHCTNGMFIYVPKGMQCKQPLQLTLALASGAYVDHVVFFADESSETTMIENLSQNSDQPNKSVFGGKITILVRPQAKVRWISSQNFSKETMDLTEKRAFVEKDATLTWVDCVFGGEFSRRYITTDLVGDGAVTIYRGLFFGEDAQQFDLSHTVNHFASHTRSDLFTRGALAGTAKTVYRGLVHIENGTTQCVGRQKEETLLLSERAEFDVIPNLEIATNDVQCGHGVSVGQLDQEKMFYLMSRGIDSEEAKKILLEGFFAPILKEVEDSSMREKITEHITKRML